MLAPDGKRWVVPMDRAHDAINGGGSAHWQPPARYYPAVAHLYPSQTDILSWIVGSCSRMADNWRSRTFFSGLWILGWLVLGALVEAYPRKEAATPRRNNDRAPPPSGVPYNAAVALGLLTSITSLLLAPTAESRRLQRIPCAVLSLSRACSPRSSRRCLRFSNRPAHGCCRQPRSPPQTQPTSRRCPA